MLAILASCDSHPALRLVVLITVDHAYGLSGLDCQVATCPFHYWCFVLGSGAGPVTAICHHVERSRVVQDLAVSSGSACTSASLEPSYVLRALGVEEDMAHTSLRSASQDPIPLVFLPAALCICFICACVLRVTAEPCLSCINSGTNPKHCSAKGCLRFAQQM